MKVKNKRFQIGKRSVKKLVALILVFFCLIAAIGAVGLWETSQRQRSLLQQDEVDSAARKRREGWIQFEEEWYAPKSDIETVLLFGVDQFEPFQDSGSYNNNGQADLFMLIILDHTQKNMTVLHINRDTMTQIPVLGVTGEQTGTMTGQLALAHTYGSGMKDSCENTVDAVSYLLGGVEIDHYIALTMNAVPQINDLVGGVPVVVLDDFTGVDDTLVKGEPVTLMGEQALHYIRTRAGLEDSTNLNRMERQQQYFESFLNQLQSLDEEDRPGIEDFEALSSDLLSDCTINELDELFTQYADYPLLDLQSIAGEAKLGTEFVEYYPDKAALQQQVLALFYEKQTDATED